MNEINEAIKEINGTNKEVIIYDGSTDPYYENSLKIYGNGYVEHKRASRYNETYITDIGSVRDFKYCLIWSYTSKRINICYTNIYYKIIDDYRIMIGFINVHVIVNKYICSFMPLDSTYRGTTIADIEGKYYKNYRYINNPLAYFMSVSDENSTCDCEIDFGKLLVMPSVSSIFKPFNGYLDIIVQTIE